MIKDFLIKKMNLNGKPMIADEKKDVWETRASFKDNPFLPQDYEARRRKRFTPRVAKRLLDGSWDIPDDPENLFNYELLKNATVENTVKEANEYKVGIDIDGERQENERGTKR